MKNLTVLLLLTGGVLYLSAQENLIVEYESRVEFDQTHLVQI